MASTKVMKNDWTLLLIPHVNYIKKIIDPKEITMEALNIERTILTSFLFADDVPSDKEHTFKLNAKAFTSSFRRALADKINQETDTDQAYGFLLVMLEDHVVNTKNELELMDIMATTTLPFTVCKRLHSKIEVEYKERLSKGLR